MPNLVEIGKAVLEKEDFEISLMYFSYYLPLGMGMALQLYNLESFSPKDAFFKV